MPERRVGHFRIEVALKLFVFLAKGFRFLGGWQFLLFDFGLELRVFSVCFREQLLADFGEEADEKSA